ncbi:MAG: hypothetical protein L6R40_002072 [Gallowayella cf. fulva]|nr:MAG: hypothetical protein L6R40_002072 [Xanthomendoza cf. fulva]
MEMASTEAPGERSPSNIYIIGAQSTGKTTLVTALGHYFGQNLKSYGLAENPHQLKEVARGVLREHGFTASDITTSKSRALELQRLIIQAQIRAEKALEHSWYIADRSALDAVAYAQQYVGESEAHGLQQGLTWSEVEHKMRAGTVILCEPGGQWLMDDGVRLMPQDRAEWFELHSHFMRLLTGCNIEYVVLPCSIAGLEERVAFVVDAWRRKR